MNSALKTSLRIFLLIVLVHANVDQLHMKFKQQCQVKKKKCVKENLSIQRFYRHFNVIHQLRFVVSIQNVMVVKEMNHSNVFIAH